MNILQVVCTNFVSAKQPIDKEMANRKPENSAIVAKYTFQIRPEPMSVNCKHKEKSLLGRDLGPKPTDRSPYSSIIS